MGVEALDRADNIRPYEQCRQLKVRWTFQAFSLRRRCRLCRRMRCSHEVALAVQNQWLFTDAYASYTSSVTVRWQLPLEGKPWKLLLIITFCLSWRHCLYKGAETAGGVPPQAIRADSSVLKNNNACPTEIMNVYHIFVQSATNGNILNIYFQKYWYLRCSGI